MSTAPAAHKDAELPTGTWEELIQQESNKQPIHSAVTYRGTRFSSFNRPFVAVLDDRREVVIKARLNSHPIATARGIANDQMFGRLGRKLGCPIPEILLVRVSPDFLAINPTLSDVIPGLAHASVFQVDHTDRLGVVNSHYPENRSRFARLALFYGLCAAGDRQLIYRKSPPELVVSVDHGHFFPGGPEWQRDTVNNDASNAVPYDEIMSVCQLSPEEMAPAIADMRALTTEDIASAVASPPEEWTFSLEYRVAAARFIHRRLLSLLRV